MAQTGNIRLDPGDKEKSIVEVLKEVNVSAFLDRWGPAHVLQVYDPDINMHGVLVIDNTTLGPSCGGIKILPNITPFKIFHDARTMTLTCALADIALGGASAGVRADPSRMDRARIIRSFAKQVSPYVPDEYIAAPDMNTTQEDMAIFAHEVQDRRGATGKPENMGGIPYELGVIGLGMGIAVQSLCSIIRSTQWFKPDMAEPRIAINGFDEIGYPLAKYLSNNGERIVAISDDNHTLYEPAGLDMQKIQRAALTPNERYSLRHCRQGKRLPKEDIVKVDCDIFIAATGTKIISDNNLCDLKAKCVIEGADYPLGIDDALLEERGILVLPNIVTTAGAAISSYAELHGHNRESAFSMIASKIKGVTQLVMQKTLESGISPRRIAREIAEERLLSVKGGAG